MSAAAYRRNRAFHWPADVCFMTPKGVNPLPRVVRRFLIASLFFGLLFVAQSFCQSGAVIPQGGAGHAAKASCVILKRMGPADEITSRLYSFGFRGKQFQYVEGKLPEGFPFHGRLTDHDVRNLQGRGAEVIILNPTFKSEELMQARADCQAATGKAPNQADAKATPSQAPTGAATPSASAMKPEPVKLINRLLRMQKDRQRLLLYQTNPPCKRP